MEKLKISDLLDYKFLSGIVASPSGKKAAFLARQANKEKNSYDSWAYIADFCTGEVRKLTSFGAESHLLFDSEDTLLFSSVRKHEDKAKDGKEKTVFYRLSLKGGEAERAFDIPYSVNDMKKMADGSYVFSATVDLNKPEDEDGLKEYQDYHIIEELPYWENGAYFVSRFRNTLFTYQEAEGVCERVTAPLFAVSGFEISGETIVYTGVSYDQVLPMKNGMYGYDCRTKTTTEYVKDGDMHIGLFGCCGEGRDLKVFFAGSTMDKYGSGQYPDLYVWENGKAALFAKHGNSVGSVPTGDISLGGGKKFLVKEGIPYFTSCARTRGPVLSAKDGCVSTAVDFDGSVECFCQVEGGFAMVGRTPGKLQEIYLYDSVSHTYRQISDLNGAALKDRYVGELHPAGFTDSDGVDIDGWVILPKDYDPSKKYPAILDMHGGPRVAFGNTMFHEMQVFANNGYFVMLCNPRGGDGRGDEFADLREKYGTIDFQDFMEFVDHVCEQYPAIDPARIGVTGGSYGGFMANWIVGHTDRFAAVASQRSIANFISKCLTTDIGYYHNLCAVQSDPWNSPEEMWNRSPLKYADKCTTPTLFIQSDEDYRCWMADALQMFTALRMHGVPTRVCLFHGENHELSRNGKPKHRVRRLKEITRWFDRYLKNC